MALFQSGDIIVVEQPKGNASLPLPPFRKPGYMPDKQHVPRGTPNIWYIMFGMHITLYNCEHVLETRLVLGNNHYPYSNFLRTGHAALAKSTSSQGGGDIVGLLRHALGPEVRLIEMLFLSPGWNSSESTLYAIYIFIL